MKSDCEEKIKTLSKQKHQRKILIKFFLVIAIFLSYLIFVVLKYGIKEGFLVTALSWSFFVLCTPIADAGFLIDFPIRLVTRIKMLLSEIIVWVIAISLNVYAFFFNPLVYDKTALLNFFKHILESPIPFWSIIFISLLGTYVSIRFGDEVMDKIDHSERKFYLKHKHKYRFLIMVFFFVIVIILYDYLLKKLGIDLPI